MSKPYRIVATQNESGFTIVIPENPNVTVHCEKPEEIVSCGVAAKQADEQKERTVKTANFT